MIKLITASFLVLFAFSAALGSVNREEIISCFGDCVKLEEIEQWKEYLVDEGLLACETKCVELWFRPEYDNTKVPELTKCNEKCVEDYRKAE
ncbi:hypothetical protein GCK72_018963 [Caenorhabditis remanei]|uniref:Uncharacterized protein n=1 Tax=Caenorhabditis remanei TaxID=31234 RepID=A0A6A5GB92_CAERE|nr:hypothetical protein GCK72_018963 [Caenorhabditis remanei]KAF1752408.1 hypothetical protein GCK72_018963 [Caenorhabditis remanei]